MAKKAKAKARPPGTRQERPREHQAHRNCPCSWHQYCPAISALMSAIMTDLLEGSVTPAYNATCNAGGKLLKMVRPMKFNSSRSKACELAGINNHDRQCVR